MYFKMYLKALHAVTCKFQLHCRIKFRKINDNCPINDNCRAGALRFACVKTLIGIQCLQQLLIDLNEESIF